MNEDVLNVLLLDDSIDPAVAMAAAIDSDEQPTRSNAPTLIAIMAVLLVYLLW